MWGKDSYTVKFNNIPIYVGVGMSDIRNKRIKDINSWNKNYAEYLSIGVSFNGDSSEKVD